MLKNFIIKCTKEFSECSEENKKTVLNDLVHFATSTLNYGEHGERLVKSLLTLIEHWVW